MCLQISNESRSVVVLTYCVSNVSISITAVFTNDFIVLLAAWISTIAATRFRLSVNAARTDDASLFYWACNSWNRSCLGSDFYTQCSVCQLDAFLHSLGIFTSTMKLIDNQFVCQLTQKKSSSMGLALFEIWILRTPYYVCS